MRNPFEKEFREKYGLNMTPGKLMIRNGSGKLPDIDILDDKGGGGGRRRRRVKTVKATGARPEPDTEPNARLPRLSKTGGRRTVPKKSPYVTVPSNGSARRCIVKVDMRNYAETTTGGRLGNKKYIATRLEPFVKNTVANSTGGNNWAKVAYIGRDEALDGKLFSCSETGSLVGGDGQTAIESFGTDPTLTVILSPEDPGADLIELTRRFMEDTYRSNAPEPPRLWVAGIHGNTKHRHVHILVSCKGVNGGDAKVSPSAIYRLRLKDGAEKILTEIQGHRGWAEEAEAQRRNRNRMRLTTEDMAMFRAVRAKERRDKKEGLTVRPGLLVLNEIKAPEKKKDDGTPSKKTEKQTGVTEKKFRAACSRRLQELKALGLVGKEGCGLGEWQFTPDAEDRLRIAEFEEEFGLTPEDIASMHLDKPFEKEYQGDIIEYAELQDGKTMLFLIREQVGEGQYIVHMHRETVKEDQKLRLEAAETVRLGKGLEVLQNIHART